MKRRHAFTLTELLVVIILIGILAALAIPRFGKTTNTAMEVEATLALEKVYQLQNIYYLKNKRYSTNVDEIGFEQEEIINSNGEGRARYLISIESASDSGYKAMARAQVKDLKSFSMDQTGKILELK